MPGNLLVEPVVNKDSGNRHARVEDMMLIRLYFIDFIVKNYQHPKWSASLITHSST